MIRVRTLKSKAAALAAIAVLTAASLGLGTDFVSAASNTVKDEASLKSAVESAQSGDTIVLANSIELTAPMEIPEGKELNIKGNTGKEKLTIELPSYSSALKSGTKAVLMIYGKVSITDLIIDAEDHMRAMYVGNRGEAVLNDGTGVINGLAGKTDTYGGAGIRIKGSSAANKAKLVINKGAYVSGNKAEGSAREGISGIGVCASKFALVELNGGTIENNKDMTEKNYMYFSNGGGLALEGAGTSLLITSGDIRNNSVKGSGGGIYIAATTEPSEIRGGSISSNTAYTTGGGIYQASSEVTMSGGSISGNKAESDSLKTSYAMGGGVYIKGKETDDSDEAGFIMTGGSITGNTARTTAKSNAHDAQLGQGGGVMTYGRFQMKGGSITGNKALSSSSLSGEAANGGGIGIGGGNYPGTVIISGGSITGNSAQNKGGAIYVNSQDLTQSMMTDYSGDIPQTPGAGILEVSGSLSVKSNSDIRGNADNIYLRENTVITVADEIDSTAEIRLGTEITNIGTVAGRAAEGYDLSASDTRRILSNDGSRIYSNDGSNIIISESADDDYTDISTAEIKNLEPEYTYTGQTVKPEPIVVFEGNELKKNTDYTLSYKKSGHDNLNASSTDTKAIVRVIGSGKYSGIVEKEFRITPMDIGNTTARNVSDRIYTGSAVEPKIKLFNGSLKLEENIDYTLSYSDNTEPGENTAKIIVKGKGNYTGSRTESFTILPAEASKTADTSQELKEFIENSNGSISSPDVIYISKDMELSEPLTIPEGKAVKLIGDGDDRTLAASAKVDQLIRTDGYLEINELTIDAKAKGRALTIGENGHAVIGDGAVFKNGIKAASADGCGGAVYNSGRLEIQDGLFSSNTALYGGAIFNSEKGTAVIANAVIRDNTGTVTGGGIQNEGKMTIDTGTMISGNRAKAANSGTYSGMGGGVYNSGSLICSGSCDISSNIAETAGAGICSEGNTELEKCIISGNTTSGTSSSRVKNCGAGVYIISGTVVMNDGSITGNKAANRYVDKDADGSSGNGGGVFVSNGLSGASFVMNGGEISGNFASSSMKNKFYGNGGGIYVMGGRNNDNSEGFGSTPGSVTLNGGTITENTASGSGSGVYIGNKESYTYNNGHSSAAYIGAGSCSISGSINISGNNGSNLHLTEGTCADMTGRLTGGENSIGITSEAGGTVTIAAGKGYDPVNEDAKVFFPDTGIRTISSNAAGDIQLKAVDLFEAGFVVNLEKDEYTFTGKIIKPDVTVTGTDGSVLIQDKDYDIEYSGTGTASKALINAGEKTVTVTGKGEYEGFIETSYNILPRSISSATVKFNTQVYTGKKLTPNPSSIKYGSYSLLKGSDYKATYKNNLSTGTAMVTISGKGNFKGTKTSTFKIIPKKMTSPKLTSPKKSQLKISWKKDSQATGYQIVMAKNSKFTSGRKIVNISSRSTVSKTVKSLKAGSRYYVKIRAYKTIKSVKYYGSYSKTVSMKVRSK